MRTDHAASDDDAIIRDIPIVCRTTTNTIIIIEIDGSILDSDRIATDLRIIIFIGSRIATGNRLEA